MRQVITPGRAGVRRADRLPPALARKTILLALGLSLVMSVDAFAGVFTPESGGSPNADDIDDRRCAIYRVRLEVGDHGLVTTAG